MQYSFKFCPTILLKIEAIISTYPKSEKHIKRNLVDQANDLCGDRYPGFSPHVIKKVRIGIPEYRIGKSGGLRYIYFVNCEKAIIAPIHLYKKGKIKEEKKIKKQIKQNLSSILTELQKGMCKGSI